MYVLHGIDVITGNPSGQNLSDARESMSKGKGGGGWSKLELKMRSFSVS